MTRRAYLVHGIKMCLEHIKGEPISRRHIDYLFTLERWFLEDMFTTLKKEVGYDEDSST